MSSFGAPTWIPNGPLKLNVPQMETLTSLWILTLSPLPHPPLPLAQLTAAPSVQARSLRVTRNLLSATSISSLLASPVPTAYHLPGPWPGLGCVSPLSPGQAQPSAHRSAHCTCGLNMLLHSLCSGGPSHLLQVMRTHPLLGEVHLAPYLKSCLSPNPKLISMCPAGVSFT